MPQEKITFEQFLGEIVEPDNYIFVQDLHNFMLESGCKETYEVKKTGLLGSYKHKKTKKSVLNVLLKKHGLLVRIYGENIGEYPDFLNTLPEEMIQSIEKASICKRLVNNGCSPKCSGYDFTVRDEHFQKCRYNCFEFLITNESAPYIKTFVENEVDIRTKI